MNKLFEALSLITFAEVDATGVGFVIAKVDATGVASSTLLFLLPYPSVDAAKMFLDASFSCWVPSSTSSSAPWMTNSRRMFLIKTLSDGDKLY